MAPAPISRNTETKLGGIWAWLLALCLNPWIVARLLTADGRFESGKATLILGTITATLIIVGILAFTKKIKLPAGFSKILLLLTSGIMAFYLTIFIDRMAGKLFLYPAQNLLFPANSIVKYDTPEFKVTARINSLGFRDYEYPLNKGNKFRILIIGDSFTFGWGVNIQDTWVKHLETRLTKEYPDTEVLNLGRSGASPETYESIAARVIPVLKPDLVIIALLQGNDLLQLLPVKETDTIAAPPPKKTLMQMAGIFTANAYPNILRLLAASALQTNVKPAWQDQVDFILRHLTPTQKARLQDLNPTARIYFLAGELNPDLVYDFLKDPDQYLQLRHTRSFPVQEAQQKLRQYLKSIQAVTNRYHAYLWAITVPNKYYLCEKTMREHTRLGAAIDPGLIRRNTPDSLVAATVQPLGIPYFSATAALQPYCPLQKVYYTYDSHFTPLGNKLFADALFTQIKEPVREIMSKRKQKTDE